MQTLDALENIADDFVLPPPDLHADITSMALTQHFLVSPPHMPSSSQNLKFVTQGNLRPSEDQRRY